jgi:isopentenyl diphosphate isomerase/L-lactate dehydrogenase-like FMN-dependent dehydrogenase
VSEPSEPINVADYERLAAERLEPGVHGYFAGGAGDERTLRDNVEAFRRWQLRPRVLVDVSGVSASTSILGMELEMPLLVAPVAFQRLAHPDGEPGMARAASVVGTAMCVSSLASASPGEVAEAAPDGTHVLQLYVFKDRGVTRALVDQAVEHGYRAILLTVDAPQAGHRERDYRTGFEIPADVTAPAVEAAVGSSVSITPRGVFELVDPALTWEGLEAIAGECPLPVLAKGVQTAEDGALAVEHGAAGVVVSNHGGRQLDCVAASLDMLPEVVEAVDGRADVLMDGGIRRGTDVVMALALGANAVLAGRAPLWGLAVGGADGAQRVLEILKAETQLALTLAGCPTPKHVTRDHVQRPPYIRHD